ncbi:MAG TPA: hypothetical protein PKM32_05765 [Planctomycetota bacterium]|nr:hypothetical protein [Planctomycetota bacterium]
MLEEQEKQRDMQEAYKILQQEMEQKKQRVQKEKKQMPANARNW